MEENLLELAAEYRRLDKRRKMLKGSLPPALEKRYKELHKILSHQIHGKSAAERRNEMRIPTAIRVRYSSEKSFINNYIHNLSSGGVFISTPKPLPLNTKVKLKMFVKEGEKEFEVEGKVVWENTEEHTRQDITRPGMGIKFTGMSEEAEEIIHEIIHDHIEEKAREVDTMDKKLKDIEKDMGKK